MKKSVQSLGLSYANDFHEMPDHLSIECELMYRLLDAEAEALQAGDCTVRDNARRAQRILHGEHLRLWVPAFLARVKEACTRLSHPSTETSFGNGVTDAHRQ